MRSLAAIFLLCGLVSCAQAPVSSPILVGGSLHGRLRAGIYQDRNDWFSIATPLAPHDPDYAQLQVSENDISHISFVDFEPLTSPGEYYRAYVEDFYATNHPVPAFDQVADQAMKVFSTGITQQRLEPIRLVYEKPWQAGSTAGLLRLYTERTPSQLLTQNLGMLRMAEDYTAYILMYVTAQKGKVAILWSEWPMDCSVCKPLVPGPAAVGDDPIDKALAANGRAKPFMDSFHYHTD